MSIRLTPEELRELIGSTRKKVQIEWLGSRGWRFDLDVNGRPIVMRSFLEKAFFVPVGHQRRALPAQKCLFCALVPARIIDGPASTRRISA